MTTPTLLLYLSGKKSKRKKKVLNFKLFCLVPLIFFLYIFFSKFQKVEVSKAKTDRLASEKNQAETTNQLASTKNQKYRLMRLPCSQDHFTCSILMNPKRPKKVCNNLSFPNMKLFSVSAYWAFHVYSDMSGFGMPYFFLVRNFFIPTLVNILILFQT